MELTTNIIDIMQDITRYCMTHGDIIPSYQKEKIVSCVGPSVSPADFIVNAAETLYAIADLLDEQGLEIAAQAANFAAINNYSNMFERGTRMVNALRRMAGEETSQSPDDDPAPISSYLNPPLVPEEFVSAG